MIKTTFLKYTVLALGICLALPSVAAPLDTSGLRLLDLTAGVAAESTTAALPELEAAGVRLVGTPVVRS